VFWQFGSALALSTYMKTKNDKPKALQELCSLVAKESDPHRLSVLLDQLIEQLDSHRQETGGTNLPRKADGGDEIQE
jgi:hypothetical protein